MKKITKEQAIDCIYNLQEEIVECLEDGDCLEDEESYRCIEDTTLKAWDKKLQTVWNYLKRN